MRFRAVGSWDTPRLVMLYSSVDDPDLPDFIDVYTGVFTYFGVAGDEAANSDRPKYLLSGIGSAPAGRPNVTLPGQETSGKRTWPFNRGDLLN